jgi:oxygen-dependent protoporphyrinogen oxidase
MNGRPLQRAIVIGGGLAGLAAAESLVSQARPCHVTLVEPAERLGGMLQTVRREGWLVERSADSFLAARPEGVALVQRLGLSRELIGIEPRARRALIYSRGRTLPVPAGFRLLAPGRMGSILASPLLSPGARLRVLAERLVPRRDAAVDDESLEHFAVRRLGREAFERIVQPLVAGIWTADPARLSMAAACPEFFEMELRHGSLWAGERRRLRNSGDAVDATGARYGQFVTLASGMDTLPATLGDALVRSGVDRLVAGATRIARRPDGRWDVVVRRPSGRSAAEDPSAVDVLQADAVVLAVSAAAAGPLLVDVDRPLADALSAIEYAGSAVVSLGFRRCDIDHPLDAAGVVVPRGEGRRILAVSFSSVKFPDRAPAGSALLRVFVGGALDPETASLGDEALESLVHAEVAAILGVRARPQVVQIDRWTRAMPQYHVGHRGRLRAIEDRLAKLPGLALAGAAYEGVGIPQVIASGQAAAARAVDRSA